MHSFDAIYQHILCIQRPGKVRKCLQGKPETVNDEEKSGTASKANPRQWMIRYITQPLRQLKNTYLETSQIVFLPQLGREHINSESNVQSFESVKTSNRAHSSSKIWPQSRMRRCVASAQGLNLARNLSKDKHNGPTRIIRRICHKDINRVSRGYTTLFKNKTYSVSRRHAIIQTDSPALMHLFVPCGRQQSMSGLLYITIFRFETTLQNYSPLPRSAFSNLA